MWDFAWPQEQTQLKTNYYNLGTRNDVGPNIRGEKIEVGRFYYPKGTEARAHAHPNEQIQVVLRGRGRFHTGGEEKILGPGDVLPDYEFRDQDGKVVKLSSYRGTWS